MGHHLYNFEMMIVFHLKGAKERVKSGIFENRKADKCVGNENETYKIVGRVAGDFI